jgi:hypothetical protein
MGPIRCPETSVNDYHTTPCNYPEDHRFHQHRGGSLKLKERKKKDVQNFTITAIKFTLYSGTFEAYEQIFIHLN